MQLVRVVAECGSKKCEKLGVLAAPSRAGDRQRRGDCEVVEKLEPDRRILRELPCDDGGARTSPFRPPSSRLLQNYFAEKSGRVGDGNEFRIICVNPSLSLSYLREIPLSIQTAAIDPREEF